MQAVELATLSRALMGLGRPERSGLCEKPPILMSCTGSWAISYLIDMFNSGLASNDLTTESNSSLVRHGIAR